MNLKELINFRLQLEQIPTELVIPGKFTDSKQACCIIGHYTRLNSRDVNNYTYANCTDDHSGPLRVISAKFLSDTHLQGRFSIVDINNAKLDPYLHEEPKDRCLAFFDDLIEWLILKESE